MPHFEKRDKKAKQFVQYTGFVLADRELSVGIGPIHTERPEYFVPKVLLRRLTYKVRGDQEKILVGHRIEAVEVEAWWARKEGILAE